MKPYSGRVTAEFRIDICLDTNILDYYLDREFKALNAFLDALIQSDSFVNLFTTRYTWFELLEVRKRHHFKEIVKTKLNIDITENQQKRFSVPGYKDYYHSIKDDIMINTKRDLEIINSSEIEIRGLIHDGIWFPTIDVCLNSRLNREDSLVTLSSLMPEEDYVKKFISIITNDKDFHHFFYSSPTIDTVFTEHDILKPVINSIVAIKGAGKSINNLTDANIENQAGNIALNYILHSIVIKNKSLFIGETDASFSTKNPEIIGIKLDTDCQLEKDDYLVFISRNLDWFMVLPEKIAEFRDKSNSKIDFPINGEIDKMVFKLPEIEDEEIKNNRADFLQEIKSTGNLVFKYPI